MQENRKDDGLSADTGQIKISDDVIAAISAVAAGEVEGVVSIATSAASDLAAGILGKKAPGRGIKIALDGDRVEIDIPISVKFGANLPDLAKKIQVNVHDSVESMTGLKVVAVNIAVVGIMFEREAKPSPVFSEGTAVPAGGAEKPGE